MPTLVAHRPDHLPAAGEARPVPALTRGFLIPVVEPFRQGDLDGLCGLYAVINAIRLLTAKLDTDGSHALFRKLAKTLGRSLANPVRPVYGGINRTVLEDLLITARHEVARHLGVEIRIAPLTSWRKRPTLADLWEALRERLDGSTIAILELAGAEDHWTVAYAASDTTIRLFDSGDMHALRRSRCTLQATETRFRLRSKGILLVTRVE